jgi:hypothetical protein
METKARMIGGNSTPRLAQMVSWKYSKMSSTDVAEDFQTNHQRHLSRAFVQELSSKVAEIAYEHEGDWTYELPQMPDVVSHIALGRDGAMTPIIGEGYREAMNGTIALYNRAGERMHTIYVTCAPEYGKQSFEAVFDMEIARIKDTYPKVDYIGLGDGAKDNWTYLSTRSDVEILDFYHPTEYLSEISCLMAGPQQTSREWLENACHQLKHQPTGAADILGQMQQKLQQLNNHVCVKPQQYEPLHRAITYFTNNRSRMKYAHYLKKNYPIGSGVTEAACKVMVKQRLCGSGMRWTVDATDRMFLIRGLTLTDGRWQQFWKHIDRDG